MKRHIVLFFSVLAFVVVVAQTNALFPYPVAPESLPVGRPRANYIVEHFWDQMPWKNAHAMPQKMENTLRGFADFLPLASADTVHRSIGRLIEGARKKPKCFVELMRIAEATFHSDTAVLYSDEVYLPFAAAAAKFKKLPEEERNRFADHVRIIETSSEGRTLPALAAMRRDGSQFALNDTTSGAASYVIIIETPAAGRFDRVSFAANFATHQLIDANLLKPILLYAGKAPEEWWESTENLSQRWLVGEMPDAACRFDLRQTPAIYLVDRQMKVISKWMPMSMLISNSERLVKSLTRPEDK